MQWRDIPDGGGILSFDESPYSGIPLELEIVVDPEEGLSWGLWWYGEFELLAVTPIEAS